MIALTPTRTPPVAPPGRLAVPAEIATRLGVAAREGRAAADAFAANHSRSEMLALIPSLALRQAGWAPTADTLPAELEQMHSVAAARTPEQSETAIWLSNHGTRAVWEGHLAQYTASVGPAQAAAAVKLLGDTLMLAEHGGTLAKSSSLRPRPFVADPTLPTIGPRPGNNPSYPSGHTYLSYASASVLSHLMPHRAAEFMDLAAQAAWARVYQGMHFPTDIVAGARVGAAVAQAVIRASDPAVAAAA